MSKSNSSEKINAYIKIIISMLIWGSVGIFRRNIPMSSASLAFMRGILGAIVLFLPVIFKPSKVKISVSRKNILLLFLSGAMVGFNWILLFESYRYTTVAVSTLCYYMQPIILILLSPVFFKEKFTVKKVICTLCSLLGMIFISGILSPQGTSPDSIKGIVLGLMAALLYAFVVILNKLLDIEDALYKTRIQLISAAVILIPYLLITGDSPLIQLSFNAVILVLIMGIIHTGIAYVLFYGSVSQLPAQSVAIISYVDPVSALILSALILHEQLTISGIIGAILIIGAALLSELAPISKHEQK